MEVQTVIEESWATGEQTIDIGQHFPGCPYIINFCNLTQVRRTTGVVRPIRRQPCASYPMVSAIHSAQQNDFKSNIPLTKKLTNDLLLLFLHFSFKNTKLLLVFHLKSEKVSFSKHCSKSRENVVVLGYLAVDNFDFTRKIVKKNLGKKLVKMLEFC